MGLVFLVIQSKLFLFSGPQVFKDKMGVWERLHLVRVEFERSRIFQRIAVDQAKAIKLAHLVPALGLERVGGSPDKASIDHPPPASTQNVAERLGHVVGIDKVLAFVDDK